MPRVMMTTKWLYALKPTGTEADYYDDGCDWLALRLGRSGKKTWNVVYRFRGQQRRLSVGTFDATTLDQARGRARKVRSDVEAGIDPAAVKKADAGTLTIAAVADRFIAEYAKVKPGTMKQYKWYLKNRLCPKIGQKFAPDLQFKEDVLPVLLTIKAKAPTDAIRAQAALSTMLTWARKEGLVEVNVLLGRDKVADERVRTRVLSDDELRTLWRTLDETPGVASDIARLRLLTGQRGGEIFGMCWTEIERADRVVWRIPADKTKPGRAHAVVLSAPAVDVLTRLDRTAGTVDRVFPAMTHQHRAQRGFLKRQREYTWHDLRRTMVTRLKELGYTTEQCALVVNHSRTGITDRVYDQSEHLELKAELSDAWATELLRIAKGGKGSTRAVVPFRRQGAA